MKNIFFLFFCLMFPPLFCEEIESCESAARLAEMEYFSEMDHIMNHLEKEIHKALEQRKKDFEYYKQENEEFYKEKCDYLDGIFASFLKLNKAFIPFREEIGNHIWDYEGQGKYATTMYALTLLEVTKWYADYLLEKYKEES
jgi:hypothetical protein